MGIIEESECCGAEIKCKICGYYEDNTACHYEDCPLLEEKLKEKL